MNAEIKKLWCAALRSEDYKQTQVVLHDECGHCCLGVLTDLAVKAGIGRWSETATYNEEDDLVLFGYSSQESEATVVLPEDVMKWAGLDSANPKVHTRHYLPQNLASLNDGGSTFAQIADLIEEQL